MGRECENILTQRHIDKPIICLDTLHRSNIYLVYILLCLPIIQVIYFRFAYALFVCHCEAISIMVRFMIALNMHATNCHCTLKDTYTHTHTHQYKYVVSVILGACLARSHINCPSRRHTLRRFLK